MGTAARRRQLLAVAAVALLTGVRGFAQPPSASAGRRSAAAGAAALFATPDPLATEGDWQAYLDEETTGLIYYFDTVTGESRWEPPTDTFPVVKLPRRKQRIADRLRSAYLQKRQQDEEQAALAEAETKPSAEGWMSGLRVDLLGGNKNKESNGASEATVTVVEDKGARIVDDDDDDTSTQAPSDKQQQQQSSASGDRPIDIKETLAGGFLNGVFGGANREAKPTEPASEKDGDEARKTKDKNGAKDKTAVSVEQGESPEDSVAGGILGGSGFGSMFSSLRSTKPADADATDKVNGSDTPATSASATKNAKKGKTDVEDNETSTDAASSKTKRPSFMDSIFAPKATPSASTDSEADNDDSVVVEEMPRPIRTEIAGYVSPHPAKIRWGGEDAIFIKGKSFGVFDGVSGAEKQKGLPLYSKTLANELKKSVGFDSLSIAEMTLKLTVAAEYADQSSTGASTAIVASIGSDGFLQVLNLGDSSCIVLRDGRITARSREISHYFDCPYQLSEDSPDRPKDGTKLNVELIRGDLIIMGSDGIFDNLTDDEVIEVATTGQRRPATIAKRIVDLSRKVSLDETAKTPYAKQARLRGDPDYKTGLGGKLDDASCIVVSCT